MFKPVLRTTLPLPYETEVSSESKAWQAALLPPKTLKDVSAITGLDLHPSNGSLLITSSSKMVMYDSCLSSKKSFYNNSPFPKFSGLFRPSDGRLIVLGSQTGKIFVYSTESTKPLREMTNNSTGSVRRAIFYEEDKVISVSDDKSINVWDLASGSLDSSFGVVHDDVIRASCLVSHIGSDNLFVSGSYDKTIKVWDAKNKKQVTSFSTTGAVESIVSKNNLIFATSDTSIQVFDLLSNSMLTTLQNIHSKSITCLAVSENNLVSCSKDGFFKVFSTETFEQVFMAKKTASKLSALAVNHDTLVVGSLEAEVDVRGIRRDILEGHVKREKTSLPKLQEYDKHLKTFNHSLALETSLTSSPEETVSVMQELIRRSVLDVAVSGKSGSDLDKMFNFVNDNLTDVRFHRTLLDVSMMLIQIYCPMIESSQQIRHHLSRMNDIINREAKLLTQMKGLSGQLDMIQQSMQGSFK